MMMMMMMMMVMMIVVVVNMLLFTFNKKIFSGLGLDEHERFNPEVCLTFFLLYTVT